MGRIFFLNTKKFMQLAHFDISGWWCCQPSSILLLVIKDII